MCRRGGRGRARVRWSKNTNKIHNVQSNNAHPIYVTILSSLWSRGFLNRDLVWVCVCVEITA